MQYKSIDRLIWIKKTQNRLVNSVAPIPSVWRKGWGWGEYVMSLFVGLFLLLPRVRVIPSLRRVLVVQLIDNLIVRHDWLLGVVGWVDVIVLTGLVGGPLLFLLTGSWLRFAGAALLRRLVGLVTRGVLVRVGSFLLIRQFCIIWFLKSNNKFKGLLFKLYNKNVIIR